MQVTLGTVSCQGQGYCWQQEHFGLLLVTVRLNLCQICYARRITLQHLKISEVDDFAILNEGRWIKVETGMSDFARFPESAPLHFATANGSTSVVENILVGSKDQRLCIVSHWMCRSRNGCMWSNWFTMPSFCIIHIHRVCYPRKISNLLSQKPSPPPQRLPNKATNLQEAWYLPPRIRCIDPMFTPKSEWYSQCQMHGSV